MTRKQRNQTGRNITYDLSNPRNIAAFEALQQDEEAEEAAANSSSSSRPSKATRQQQARKKREKEKFFLLKDDVGSVTTPPASQEEQVQLLLEMFEGAADRSLVNDVYQASGCSVEAAAEALFGLLGGGGDNTVTTGPAEPSRPAAAAAAAGGTRSFAAAAAAGGAGASSSSAAASKAAAAALARQQQQQQQQQQQGELSVSWGDLPPDVCSTILSQLTPQDLARAASTCGEFRDWANAMRAHVRHLVLQPGVSYSCLKGVVSSHVAAGVMDFTRFERHIAKQDPKELLPQVVAMHKQEAEAALFKGLMAVAEGSTAPCRRVPVTGLVLRGLVGVTDRLLAEALQNLRGLRSLDVSNCPNITNKSLYLLAKYKATQGLSSQHTQSTPQQPSTQQQLSTQQPSTQQQQELQEAQGEDEEEFVYGWASSSSSEDEGEDDDSSSSSEGADDAPGGQGEPDTAAGAAAGESAADMPDTAARQAMASGGASGQGSARPDISGATTAAASVGRQMAALEIQASLFHRPKAQLLGAADAQAAAEQGQADVAEDPAATATAPPAAAAEAGGLVELKLAGNRAFMDDGLRQVLQNPAIKHSLSKLDISNCRSITSAGLVIPPLGVLRELKACRVHGLQQLVLHLPSSHPLASLDLSNCHYLQVLDLHLSGLTTLNLSACRTLYRLRMRCPALESLSLAQCGNLFDFHDDAWQVPALQQLNMYGCRRASGPQLQVVLDRLPALQWISLNGCHGITTLHLTRNLELQSVDLSGCRFLSAFSCASPALQQLTAASCSRLGSLTLGSNNMRVLLLPNCKQLATVHISTPSPAEAAAAAVAVAAASSTGGRRDGDQPRSGAEGSSSSSRGRGSGRSGVLLDTKGCVSLPAEGRARLVAAMAGTR